ncbi:phosphotransferase [Patescibacteria group bacterium]|nr:phosphotransferase [Patescibacteria group bacterium]MBU4512387.1 phosphotransferase [Patescibacteria group bacterium]
MKTANPNNFLDPQFMSEYFANQVTGAEYKDVNWKNVRITPIKEDIGKFYHLVIRYDVQGIKQPIFCTANAKEDREHAYQALTFIDDQSFFKGKLASLKPLFYDPEFKAMFYLGIDGKALLDYIKDEPEKVESLIKLVADWLTELHQIKADITKHTFNPLSVRIETIAPGSRVYLEKIKKSYPGNFLDFKKIFAEINIFDERNLRKNRQCLIHGDLHPENVVINAHDESEITIIDYTDICVADFARDLGNFLQQFEYMTSRYNQELSQNMASLQKSFLNEYLNKRDLELYDELRRRISMYMAWTAFRSATFFLTKGFAEREEAEKLIKRIPEYIDMANNNTLPF